MKLIRSLAPLVDEMYGEYLNVVIGMSADDFFDMMWNQKNEIYQDILKYEEIFEFAWRKFPYSDLTTDRVSPWSPDVSFILVSGKKTGGKLDLMRKMHAPMGPNQAAQHLEFSEEFSTSSRGDQIHTIQIHTKTDSMPFADKFDVRER